MGFGFTIRKYVPIKIAIATMRSGISCTLRNDKVVAVVAPKVESIANPTGPQAVQTPAPAPKTEPKIPVPILVLAPIVLILYVTILITREISPAVMIINPKLRVESCGR